MTPEDITPVDSVAPVLLEPVTPEPPEPPILGPSVDELRRLAYQKESDPLFFKWQRGEATEQEWLDAIQSIKNRYPEEETPWT